MARAKRFIQNNNNNAYCYYRYSSKAQRDVSIEQQKKEAHRFCKEHNLHIIGEFADRAISGTEIDRPQLQLMMNEIEKVRPAYLILWKVDRLSRDRLDSALLKGKLRSYGVKVEYVAEHLPENEAERALLESFYEGAAASEVIRHSQNVTRGLMYNAENALYNGHKILGYSGCPNQKYAIDSETAPIVQRIFSDYANGKSMREIADALNASGHRTIRGNEFTEKSLLHTLHNRSYIGEYSYSDVVIKDGMPRIVSDGVFDKVQEMLEQNRHNGRGNAKKINQLRGIDFWLTGKLFCGECGNTMSGISGTSKQGNLHYYYACNSHKKHLCEKKNVKKDDIEEIVREVLKECLNDSALKVLIAQKVYSYYLREYASDENYEKSIIANIKDTDSKLKNIMKAIEDGIYNDTTQARMLELQERKSLLQDELKAEQNRKKHSLQMEHIVRYLNCFVGDFDDVVMCRKVLNFLIEKIYVYDDRLIINFYYSDDKRTIDFAEFKAWIENLKKILKRMDGYPNAEGSSSSSLSPLNNANPNQECSDIESLAPLNNANPNQECSDIESLAPLKSVSAIHAKEARKC